MQKYSILISYIGAEYHGWQRQKCSATHTKSSIQATLENAIQKMTGESCSVVGSGRTDSGVHAAGQVAHFILKNRVWDPQILQRGLNGILPMSIRILGVSQVSLDFHAQRSAEKKQYSYYFQQGPCPLPHLEPYSWWIHKHLDIDAMQTGLNDMIGEHDFKPFQASGAKPGPTIRRILEATVTLQSIGFPSQALSPIFEEKQRVALVRVRVVGTGFLKQMVRGIAGTLLQVGEKRRSSSCFREILESGDRLAVGPTAPARALWLEQVWYPQEHGLPW
jgi:tRNA pseudouridine38-40 synthase